ncbi:ABC transporter ATP-binding protein [Zavarzinia sp.]|uniref:ABC transporter ATP-binding protein n=1 Tax=Zavarzinia sp. TaxID=2027920 RepID=UPI003BB61080
MTVLDFEDVVIHYRVARRLAALVTGRPHRIEAVAGVTLGVPYGKTYALVGESGSGKTTLGRAAVGLVPVTSGVIRIDGADAQGFGDGPWRQIRRNAALMFQDPMASLNPRMRVAELIAEPLAVHRPDIRDRDARAAALLDRVGLHRGLLDRFPHELSGGQARRVSVARALALEPKLIIADEPTAGLDVSVQGEILNLLMDIQDSSRTAYFIITHNLAIARHVTDYIGIMYLGRLVEQGSTAQIFAAPAHPYTNALLTAQVEALGSEAAPLQGEVPSLWERPPGCEFHPRCPMARETCRILAPPTLQIAPGHQVACHFPIVAGETAGANPPADEDRRHPNSRIA